MKKFLSVVSLLMALMMLCTSALANEQKYDEPVTVHFVRSTDDTLDANYFQHVPYLDDFNAENGTHLVSVLVVHVEPMGLYGGKQTTS